MKCKKLVRTIIAFAVAGSMSMTVNATSISDLKDQKDQKESKKEEAEEVKKQVERKCGIHYTKSIEIIMKKWRIQNGSRKAVK